MDVYLHDTGAALRFVVRGELAGGDARNLEHAWTTATSILGSRALVVDVSGVTHADAGGRELLARMRQSGARVTAGAESRTGSKWRGLRNAIWANLRHLLGIRRGALRDGGEKTRVSLDVEMH